MEDRILSLFFDYSDNKRFIDNYFINQFYVIVSSYFPLSDYLKDVIINTKYRNKTSFYSVVFRIISINLELIHNQKIKHILSDKDYVYWYNLSVISILFHELEHVKQEKHRLSHSYDIKKRILVLEDIRTGMSMDNLIKKIKSKIIKNHYNKYYNQNHDLIPCERMANIESYKAMDALINRIEKPRDVILNLQLANEIELIGQLRYGYHLVGININSPTIECLNHIHHNIIRDDIDVKKILENSDLSFDERLYYGLSLTKDEYDALFDKDFIYRYLKR